MLSPVSELMNQVVRSVASVNGLSADIVGTKGGTTGKIVLFG